MSDQAGWETISVTVTGDRKTHKVCFLESGKEFLDVLLSLLQLPTGTILKLLSEDSSASGSLPGIWRLYNSVKKLDKSNFSIPKEELTNPPRPRSSVPQTGLLLGPCTSTSVQTSMSVQTLYYGCQQDGCRYISTSPVEICPAHSPMSKGFTALLLVSRLNQERIMVSAPTKEPAGHAPTKEPAGSTGYVKENAIYIISDSLEVFQSSSMQGISLANKMNISISDIFTTSVEVTQEKMLAVVKESFTGKGILNAVFGPAFKMACFLDT